VIGTGQGKQDLYDNPPTGKPRLYLSLSSSLQNARQTIVMETTVQAVYEGGVLRSLQPVPFQDRQEVTVTVRVSHEGNIRRDHPLLVSADEWANAATDEISLEEVRRALSRISGSLSKAIIRER